MTSQKTQVKLTDVIAPAFYSLHWDIIEGRHTYYKLDGGRGSCKSSFCGSEIIYGMMDDANKGKMTNAVVFRRYGVNLHDSVYEQLVWAIDKLGVNHLWKPTLSPLRLTYKPTGQVILFRGADKAVKSKSIKVSKGYIKYLWFEELDEFEGPEKIRSIQQSVIRGGDKFIVFYSYNPPKSQRNWVNDPIQWTRPDTVNHHSSYLTVPRHWLGEQFIADAEHLRDTKPDAYRHEYLGEITGSGIEVFNNLRIERITDEQLALYDYRYFGQDWGWYPDPNAFNGCAYNANTKTLLLYEEFRGNKCSNADWARKIEHHMDDIIKADPGSGGDRNVSDFCSWGFRMREAQKGPGSVDYGIKWLQSLHAIIIDPERCPNTAKEFSEYEYERDPATGEVLEGYPDADNHHIDAVRYAMETVWKRRGR